ncbi:MAG TPA: NAD(P)-binding protein, partial [Candidatus Dormibacteraeota bacterium]|nr:NAD(P)-binding protein [Candidatus Dormibacteraeota bacterium]
MIEKPPPTRRFVTPSERHDSLRASPTVVLGGGPAGLTAGYLLAKQGLPVIVLEAHEKVGGLAMTEERDGYRFDLGGHR